MTHAMPSAKSLLLDTNVVLHLTRDGNTAAKAIDSQFALSTSRFRPSICEVTVGELLAFTLSNKWGDKRIRALRTEIDRCLLIPISTPGVHDRWASISSAAKKRGVTIGQNDLWIAAAASVSNLTVLTTDTGDFGQLRRLGLVDAILLDAKTGLRLP